ncbi:T9SS type A sorting domain-containing protein [Mariniflexile gromovii]|uniref:T9SS type A sorting domain-containing protein n=1 Tax=Mariniflexile gromovii TaxID=362523 RepID=A0ABS4BXU5_9FLAO|nr:T9SS type A sorting domain-containing protein [Mariniflexile gromovii]MBP0905408.1 T9SS type A sorting domain-containing protein [Mariniflexile gromovii]
MHKPISLIIFFLALLSFSQATSGPAYIKQALTTSGVYNAPSFEFTTAYDAYNTVSVNGTIRGLFYQGLPYTQAVNSNNETKIFAWYGEPAGLSPGDKVPAVILVHGGGGRAYTEWVAEWVNRGYIAIAMSNRGTTPDDSAAFQYAGPSQPVFFSDNDGPLQDQWFYHAIANAMLSNSLLRNDAFTTHVDKNNIGITGISWGGIINTVIAGIDERLDFVIPVYGCGFLYDSPVYSKQFASMSKSAQDFYLENWEPSLYTPLHSAPMLFVNGNKDLQFTLNIFGKTYETSNSPEKFLRIQDLMGHGHGAGRRPEEIYDFADYVTGLAPNAVKPLEFTSEQIDSDKNISYSFNFDGPVDEALLFYTKDTLQWGKTDDKYLWLTKTANLNKSSNSGLITTTVPEDAQAYYVNVNNTTDGLMYSSVIKYAIRDYEWYNYETAVFNTRIDNSSGGTFTDNTTNPNTSGINPSTHVGKFERTSGDAKIVFNLTKNITDVSIFKQKIKLYINNPDLASISNNKVRLYLSNSEIDYKTSSLYEDITLNSGAQWVDYNFDFTNKTVPSNILSEGGFNQVILVFAPDDTTSTGIIYYFDDLRGTINQPEYVAPEPYYDWLNYGKENAVEEINYASSVGGNYTKTYNVSLDAGVTNSGSASGLATKFTKTTENSWKFAQIRYDFEDGIINNTQSITFKLKALIKPETISEINILNEDSRSVSIYLQDRLGGTNLNQKFVKAYFTQTNAWETLEFTFTASDLNYYDRLVIMVASGLTYPVDEDGKELTNEDLTYYFESLTANENINSTLSTEVSLKSPERLMLYPNPVNKTLRINKVVEEAEILNQLGQKVHSFKNTDNFNVINLKNGLYFLKVNLKNKPTQVYRFIKK